MKYIRTKDGRIIDLTFYKENGIINNGIKFVHKLNGSYFFVQQDNIINQADTIEELCDEFVGVMNEDGSHIWYNDEYCGMDTTEYLEIEESFYKKILWNTVKRNVCLGETIYGAIWTDKGLIYVAKMNESGCLELI